MHDSEDSVAVAKVRSLALSLKTLITTIVNAMNLRKRTRHRCLYNARGSLERVARDFKRHQELIESCGGTCKWLKSANDLLHCARSNRANVVAGKSRKLLETLARFVEKTESLIAKTQARALAA